MEQNVERKPLFDLQEASVVDSVLTAIAFWLAL